MLMGLNYTDPVNYSGYSLISELYIIIFPYAVDYKIINRSDSSK